MSEPAAIAPARAPDARRLLAQSRALLAEARAAAALGESGAECWTWIAERHAARARPMRSLFEAGEVDAAVAGELARIEGDLLALAEARRAAIAERMSRLGAGVRADAAYRKVAGGPG